MNDLLAYFENNTKNRIHKWMHYFEVYDKYFSRYRGTDVHLLEIGVYQGGSLQMWKEYFGPKARIFAVDIDPACKATEDEQTKIFIGDQADRAFLRSLKQQVPRVDILLDDGGHMMEQQIVTFEELYPHITSTGLYLCEDTCTSYWDSYRGGYKDKHSYIEYTKNLIDQVNAWHSQEHQRLSVTEFTRSTLALHYYNGIVVIEKHPIEKPYHQMTGRVVLPVNIQPPPGPPVWLRVLRKIRRVFANHPMRSKEGA